jgi:broad specificity phosphatase PhoE/ribonuclease HI
VSVPERIIVEADGGSRGNPGAASFGALVRDAVTGRVIAERGETIGIATNNVAEYRGLIAGLELAAEYAPHARVEVRMDSKLVVEQMAGRWKIKHPAMVPLALRARDLVPADITWTWVPRERNKAADALANRALDEQARTGAPAIVGGVIETLQAPTESSDPEANKLIGWRGPSHGKPTTLVMLRHGETANTVRKAFCGSGGSDPSLTAQGAEQARRAARWLAERGGVEVIVSSPMRRTRETAELVADALGLDIVEEPGVAEAAFGEWDGYTFGEVMERDPQLLEQWLGAPDVRPPGGESMEDVALRVEEAHRRLLRDHAGKEVLVVSHVTPIKLIVRRALDAPMSSMFKMELAPASLTTISWWPDGASSMRGFSVTP